MFLFSAHVMTLANSIIGVGILAMPFCFQKCGIILSIVLLVLSNWITRVCCHYLIKTSLLTRRRSFELLGLHAFGASGKLLAELCIIGYLIGTCITYFVVVGDLGPSIVAKLFSIDPNEHRHLRSVVMVVMTILCIVPLGMLRNVDSLSILCTASIGFYVCLMFKIVLESETHILAHDWTEKVLYWEPAGILQCLPIFSMASSCQMQLFEVFESINNQSLEKLNGIVRNATWICTFVYIAVGFFGYVAFFSQTAFSGNILVNLSPSFGSDIIKIGFVFSIAFSFPLVIFPCRASIYSLLYRKGHSEVSNYIPEQRFRAITLFIVGFSLCVALVIPSVELIIGLVGSTIGVAICIMFPASSFRKIIKKESRERSFAQLIFVSGFVLMILGTYANLNAIDEKSSGPHFEEKGQVATPIQLQERTVLPPLDLPLKDSELLKHLAKEVKEEPQQKPKELVEDPVEIKKEAEKSINLVASSEKSPLPPLPVDEVNPPNPVLPKSEDAPEITAKLVLPAAVAPLPADKMNSTIDKVKPDLPENVVKAPVKTPPLDVPAQQTIDGAAIKKDEEVAAEEQKENKVNADELRKTQNELKKTKELLERTVDELKEELAKQNQETHELVEEVAKKVEEIEQKVIQDKPKEAEGAAAAPVKEAAPIIQAVVPAVASIAPVNQNQAEQPKANLTLIDLLTENVHAREEQEAHAGVFEPLSYKTGELLKNKSIEVPPALAQRLPLPLALLRNGSAAQSEVKEIKEAKVEPAPAAAPNKTASNIEEENVEAIRRELLQVKAEKSQSNTESASRVKREANEPKDCLPEPKFEINGGNGALLSQMENIGRDLKFVQEEDETTLKPETTLKES